MCSSIEASGAMVAAGAVATLASRRKGHPTAVWVTLGYFTVMEALQVAGYAVVDACGTPENRAVTLLSYLHIAFQPLFINAFALVLVPTVSVRLRAWVMGLCALASGVMLAQIAPVPGWGTCQPGLPLCGEAYCTVSGNWHIAWNVPYNGLMGGVDSMLGTRVGFPSYMAAVFFLPLLYGAWRFVLMHLLLGPVLAVALTDNPNEMPAIWCLFSIAILLVAFSPLVRRTVGPGAAWGATA